MNSLLTLTTQDIPLPAPTDSVWLVLKLRRPYLLEVIPVDVDALRKRIKARRRIRGEWGGGEEGA